MRIKDGHGNEMDILDDVVLGLQSRITQELSSDMTVEAAVRLMEEAGAQVDRLISDANRRSKPALACKKGCAWCCYLHVSVSPMEVIRIVEYVRSHFSPEETSALRDRAAQAVRVTRGLTSDQHERLKVACPLLVGNQCSVYPARPLACRGWNSRSVQPCRHNVEHAEDGKQTVYFFKKFKEAADSARTGVALALDALPMQNEVLELAAAIDAALNVPDASERWLLAEPVFAEAVEADTYEP